MEYDPSKADGDGPWQHDLAATRTARRIRTALGYLTGTILVAATFVISVGVVGRRILAYSVPWAVDAAVLTMIVVTFLGATAVALDEGGHITVDLVTSRVSDVRRRRLEFFSVAVSVVTLLLVAAAGLDHVFSDMASGRQYAGNYVRVPRAWVMGFVPLGLVMLSAVYVVKLYRMWRSGHLRRED